MGMDEIKVEPESHNKLMLPDTHGMENNIPGTTPVIKCETEFNLDVIKEEADSGNETWSILASNEDIKKDRKPGMFTFVSVNAGGEEVWDAGPVKQELKEEVTAEEHEPVILSLDNQEDPVTGRCLSNQFESNFKKRKLDAHIGDDNLIIDWSDVNRGEKSNGSVVTDKKLHSCHLCGKQLQHRRNLTIHLRTHTRQNNFSCDVCNKEFTRKENLKTHFRIHTGEKPFKCDFCNMQFSQNGDLVRHRRVHTGDKPYVCDICSKTFSENSALTSHRRIHTGEKPYKCVVCGKEFSNSSNFALHCRAHTCEKPYKCEVCLKVFSRWGVLSKHRRSHTGDKAPSCDICNKNCTSERHLKRHYRVHAK